MDGIIRKTQNLEEASKHIQFHIATTKIVF